MDKLAFNRKTAQMLRDCATHLTLQDANPFRIAAYQNAAATLESLHQDVRVRLREHGIEGLTEPPTIGRGLAATIAEIAATGRSSQLDRLRGTADPEALFQSIPGIGRRLAHAIHETLDVDSLESLEIAAHDGRLETVPGIGSRRANAIRNSLTASLGRAALRMPTRAPTVRTLLTVDREYREKARANKLPRIAPRRFNASGKAWLPILHTRRGQWGFTALFSNTARAHKLKRTRDWVLVYFYDGEHSEGQCTIVTETKGELEGQRVVRGREAECRKLVTLQAARPS